MDFNKLFGIDTNLDSGKNYSNPIDQLLSNIQIPTSQNVKEFSVYANQQLVNKAIPQFFEEKKVAELALIAEGKCKLVKMQLLIMYDGTVALARQKLYELVGHQKYQEYADRFVAADIEFNFSNQSRNESSKIHFQYTGKKGPEKKAFDFMAAFASEKPVGFGDFIHDFQEPETVFEQPDARNTQTEAQSDEYTEYEIIDEQPDIATKNIEFNKAVSKMIDDLKAKKEVNGLKSIVQSKPKSVDGGDLELTQETIEKAKSALSELGVE